MGLRSPSRYGVTSSVEHIIQRAELGGHGARSTGTDHLAWRRHEMSVTLEVCSVAQ